jgi:hypothetical protein
MEVLEEMPKGGPRRAKKWPQREPWGAREGKRGMGGRLNQRMGAPKKALGSPKDNPWEPGKGPGKGPKKDPQEAWERALKGALGGSWKEPRRDIRGVWEKKKRNGKRTTKSNKGGANKSPWEPGKGLGKGPKRDPLEA